MLYNLFQKIEAEKICPTRFHEVNITLIPTPDQVIKKGNTTGQDLSWASLFSLPGGTLCQTLSSVPRFICLLPLLWFYHLCAINYSTSLITQKSCSPLVLDLPLKMNFLLSSTLNTPLATNSKLLYLPLCPSVLAPLSFPVTLPTTPLHESSMTPVLPGLSLQPILWAGVLTIFPRGTGY